MRPSIRPLLLCALLSIFLASCGSNSGGTNSPPAKTLTYLLDSSFPTGGTHPEGVVIADFNGDGKPDIAVSNLDTNTVAVYLNQGSGKFSSSPIITTVQIPNGLGSIAVGDFNEDGKQDLVAATISGPQVNIVLLGNGDGTFRQLAPIPNSFGFFDARVADLNRDGHQDLVFAGNAFVAVSLGRGDGTFVDTVYLPVSTPGTAFAGTVFDVAVADFNGDGKLDIVAANPVQFGSGNLIFFAGNGDGTFQNAKTTPLPSSFLGSLSPCDFKNDGKTDLLIGTNASAFFAPGNGDGTFQTALSSDTFVYSTQNFMNNGINVIAADLHADSKLDAVIADFNGGMVQISLNSAFGQSPPKSGLFPIPLSKGVNGIAVGDLNGDGVSDVVASNYLTNQVSIILSAFR